MATTIKAIAAAAAALTLLALPTTGDAQSGASRQPIAFGGDTLENTADGVVLRGRAEVVQGGNRLRADVLSLVRASDGDLQRIDATGTVYLVTSEQSMRGDRAVYTPSSGEVVVTGDVILTQGQNVLTGGRLVYNVNTEAARMEGAPRGAAGRRVQGVFYPEGTN
ncbi:LptA/OstA family protein [Brevundimonas sp. PAMC22021]|uniref:LptA/OstA family protein n=1 Tax=Brevundimonas sp. PAMC22021 TaxID=2861285 RepID=UPI001C634BE2|nr:LptA/OstA family protein [Brevundimonas sp. PAMC22021]QYF86305.1 LPS ABC transporter substrate-binding protein LptA [Brevundimonas sp. PAMC22021]